MEERNEPSLREKFASLLVRAKLGDDITEDIKKLLPESINRDVDLPPFKGKNANKYREYLSFISDISSLYFILIFYIERKLPKRFWGLTLTIERIVEVLDKEEGDHIFQGDIDKVIIFIDENTFKGHPQKKHVTPIAVMLDSSSVSFSPYPFSYFFPSPCREEKREKVISDLESNFKNSSDYYFVSESTWLVKILDKKGEVFDFRGIGTRFPFSSSFSIPLIPSFLEIKDMEEKDKLTFLSMQYSRLSFSRDEEILESVTLNEKKGIVKLEHYNNDLDFNVSLKDKKSFVERVFGNLDFYDFYPKWMDFDKEETVDETQPYYRTRYTLSYESAFGRKEHFHGLFTSYDLPKGWDTICTSLHDNIDYVKKMESTDLSRINIGRTNSNTVFACGVVFSEYSKEYLYIAPDGTYYPGMKVMVPAGSKNTLQVVTNRVGGV
ncbi:MAG: hypothetical protein ACI4SL_02700 [Candidatus Ornithospirochaeta sp.]